MAGDLLGSFIKRRSGIEEGKQFFLDQVLFIIVALAFGYPVLGGYYTIGLIVIILLLTYVFHVLFNVIANRLGIKKVPW
jgi:CDP-diglyceride synthetase